MRIKIVDMNSYRRATRDLLLEYDSTIMPPHPRAAGLSYVYNWLESNKAPDEDTDIPPMPTNTNMSMVYPWEQTNLGILSQQLYTIAANSGYNGTYQEFNTYFGSYLERNQQEILFDIYSNFPQVGANNILYFDLEEKVLYYWDGQYLPVNAMLIANTILNGGDA